MARDGMMATMEDRLKAQQKEQPASERDRWRQVLADLFREHIESNELFCPHGTTPTSSGIPELTDGWFWNWIPSKWRSWRVVPHPQEKRPNSWLRTSVEGKRL